MRVKKLIALGISLSLLLGCHSEVTMTAPVFKIAGQSATDLPAGAFRKKPTPHRALMSLQPQSDNPNFMQASFTIDLPAPIKQSMKEHFKTQALPLNLINYVKAEIDGIGIATTLWADGADVAGLVANVGGDVTLTVSNVPYGKARVATLTAYDAAKVAIPGAVIKASFDASTPVTNLEMAFRSVPSGMVVEDMLNPQSTANDHLTSLMSLTDLNNFVDTITGVSGSYPTYSYTHHPTWVNYAQLATDLLGNGGDPTVLTANDYKITPGSVDVTIAGLLGTDTADIQVTDPASSILSGVGNGGAYTIPQTTPGNWITNATATGYTASSSPATAVTASTNTNVGTITFTWANTPNITTLSTTNATVGTSIQINGTDFHPQIAGNTVTIGGVNATVTAASPTQLTVTVPSGIFDTQNVQVSVGTVNSNTVPFDVIPSIASLVASANTIGSSIQINGEGFDPTAGNNTVKFGTTSATVTAATNTQLTVTVPAGIYDTEAVTVQVDNQTSSGSNFDIVPRIDTLSVNNGIIGTTLNLNGSGFDPTAGNNTVEFNGVTATVNTATTTQLNVTVPANVFGNTPVTAQVDTQTSAGVGFDVTPNITSLSSGNGQIGTAITINGTGFDTTAGNNTVKFNGVNATVNTATTTQLNVTIPTAANGNVTNQVGTQTSNGLAFNVRPTVTLTAPTAAAIINGNASPLAATVVSGNPVTQVEFFYGAVSIGVDNTFPYTFNWDTTLIASGAHTLTARVTDSIPNVETSAGVNITINQPPVISSINATVNPVGGLEHPVQLTCNATDVEDALTYTWTVDGGPVGTFSAANAAQTFWTAPNSAGGPYDIRCSVSDGVNPNVESTVNVSVTSGSSQVNITGGFSS